MLDAGQQARLATLPAPDPDSQRWVVVDVETTGLNLQKDLVLSIGAVAIVDGAIDLSQSFECTLRRETPASASTLIHGLGPEALSAGVEPAEGLLAFLDYLGGSPLLAFHAAFDQQMLGRACRETLGISLAHPFLDLAELAPSLRPDSGLHGLDDWIGHFGLSVQQRHHASADAMVSAELTLILLSLARGEGVSGYTALQARCAAWRRRQAAPGL